jgi:hypothetical protein
MGGNAGNFIAIPKVGTKGIVAKTSFWVATAEGRVGPFEDFLGARTINGTNWQSYCAIEKSSGKLALAYGTPLAGSTLPALGEAAYQPDSSSPGMRWTPTR